MTLDQWLYNWLFPILLWWWDEICLQRVPKFIFLSIGDKRHFRVFALRLIPLVDADRDKVPNEDPTLSSKWVLGPAGFNRFAIIPDLGDRELFIRAQPFFRASSPYRTLARSGYGGLEKNKGESLYMYTYQNN